MAKSEKEAPHVSAPHVSAPKVEAATVCSVCGQGGEMTGSAGPARWHAACEAARPDVIAKVKARAGEAGDLATG